MLDALAALAHGLRVLVEPALDGFENLLMLPTRDAALLARGAERLHGAVRAEARPIAAYGQFAFFARVTVGETLASRADIDALNVSTRPRPIADMPYAEQTAANY